MPEFCECPSDNRNIRMMKDNLIASQILDAKDYIRKHMSKDGSEDSRDVCIIRNLLNIIRGSNPTLYNNKEK